MINRFYCIFLVIFVSCVSKEKAPSDMIQPEEMKNIMWDIMRAQTLAVEISRRDSMLSDTAETKALVQKVFEIHKIRSADFDKSYNWYVKHPGLMSLMFDSLYMQKQRNELRPYLNNLKTNKPPRKNLLQWDLPQKKLNKIDTFLY
jgi:hypothetical protein